MTEKSIKRITRISLWAFVIILFLVTVFLLSDIILILIFSILLAFIFIPFVGLLEKEGLSRLVSTLIVFGTTGLLLYVLLSFIIPKFVVQMDQMMKMLQSFSLHDQLVQFEAELYRLFPFFTPGQVSQKIEEFISSQFINSFDTVSELLSGIVSVVLLIVIIPFISFFLVKDSRKIMKNILHIIPNNYFEMSYWILKKVSLQLGRFVRAWIFDATFVGTCMGLGLYFIGVNNALPLGVIAGLGHLVPYFGPVIGGVPAIIVAVIQTGDLSLAPFIILLVIITYMLDNGFVQPYVFSKSVDMHPIIIILLIIAGSQLFGILGMLLAVPTASVIKTAAKEIYFAFKNYKIARL
jgi:predicted PurR-regulated permease PerM